MYKMMRLTRVRNGGVGIELVVKLLIPPSGIRASEYGASIAQLLEQAPKETFLMLLWDLTGEDKEPDVKGFILAFAPQGVDYVSLLQCHPRESHQALSDSFSLWCESQGRAKVRYEQFNGTDNVPRFLKFKVISLVLEHTIIRDVEGTHELPENVTRDVKKQEVKDDGDSNKTDEVGTKAT
jgi:hypothetical protein